MSGYETIIVSREAPAGIIKFNRPQKYNALDLRSVSEVCGALEEFGADADIRGIILIGDEKFFSTGADLDDVAASDARQIGAFLQKMRPLTDGIERYTKPVIAAISGWCLTGGLEVAMACDIRVADTTARFGITSAKIGTVCGMGGTQRLPRIVGVGKAKELLFSADFIDAQEALRINLINRVVPAGRAIAEAKSMIQTYTQRAPISLEYIKQAVNVGINLDLQSALDLESALCSRIFYTEDRVEGLAAFHEKRQANFRGR